jgi:4a-hydroxytetrahydrobiopterin dehydratase
MNKELINKIKLDLNEWMIHNELLVKEFVFSTFQDAINFVNTVAKIADEADHHPDIFISYNKVKISLITHDLGEISEKDYSLAKEIESLEV